MSVPTLFAKRPGVRIPAAVFLLALASACTSAGASRTLTTAEARNHVGETATVRGHVASAHYAARSKGQPTFINLDKPYPNSPCTVVISGSDQDKFRCARDGPSGPRHLRYAQTKEYREHRRSSPGTRSRLKFKAQRLSEAF